MPKHRSDKHSRSCYDTTGRNRKACYTALQKLARSEGRPTQELLQFYVLEAFLDRIPVPVTATTSFSREGFCWRCLASIGQRATSTSRPKE